MINNLPFLFRMGLANEELTRSILGEESATKAKPQGRFAFDSHFSITDLTNTKGAFNDKHI